MEKGIVRSRSTIRFFKKALKYLLRTKRFEQKIVVAMESFEEFACSPISVISMINDLEKDGINEEMLSHVILYTSNFLNINLRENAIDLRTFKMTYLVLLDLAYKKEVTNVVFVPKDVAFFFRNLSEIQLWN